MENYAKIGEGTTEKIAIVQGRIVVADLAVGDYKVGGIHYNFFNWIGKVEGTLPAQVSVEEFVRILKQKSNDVWLRASAWIKDGTIKREEPGEYCQLLAQYVIAGYEEDEARIYEVEFYIDWGQGRVIGLDPVMIEPQVPVVGNFHVHFFGMKEAITEITDPRSYAYKRTLAKHPKLFQNLLSHQDIPLDDTVALTRAFIEVEEDTNPGDVGGRIHAVEILPDGKAHVINDVERKPKTAATRAEHQ
jgi:hypothetical protein